jgi:hypothetical protein
MFFFFFDLHLVRKTPPPFCPNTTIAVAENDRYDARIHSHNAADEQNFAGVERAESRVEGSEAVAEDGKAGEETGVVVDRDMQSRDARVAFERTFADGSDGAGGSPAGSVPTRWIETDRADRADAAVHQATLDERRAKRDADALHATAADRTERARQLRVRSARQHEREVAAQQKLNALALQQK